MSNRIHLGMKEYIDLEKLIKILKSEFEYGFTSFDVTKLMQQYCRNRNIRPYKNSWNDIVIKLHRIGLLSKEEGKNKRYIYNFKNYAKQNADALEKENK